VLAALAQAEAIVIGPSNPVASIAPILALPGMKAAIAAARAPVVAVSPFVGGRVLKGPTEVFCRHAGIRLGAEGMFDAYPGLIDGLVADEHVSGCPALKTATLMDRPEDRRRLATEILDFAGSLPGAGPDSA
jgi:LPPG:FO 2-phospho-L-lactate transferase